MLLIAGEDMRFSGSSMLRGGDMDLLFVGVTVLFFVVSGWFITFLEKL